MNCTEFRARLHPYVDGELPVAEMAAADAHGALFLNTRTKPFSSTGELEPA